MFEAEWKSGDHTWVPYLAIRHLGTTAEYLDLLGCADIVELGAGSGQPLDDPQVYLGYMSIQGLGLRSIKTHHHRRKVRRQTCKVQTVSPPSSPHSYNHPPSFDLLLANFFHGIFGTCSNTKMSPSHASFI